MKKPYVDPFVEELHVSVSENILGKSDVDIDIDDLFETEQDIPGGVLFN